MTSTRRIDITEAQRDALHRLYGGEYDYPNAITAYEVIAAWDAAPPAELAPQCAEHGCRLLSIDRTIAAHRPVLDALAAPPADPTNHVEVDRDALEHARNVLANRQKRIHSHFPALPACRCQDCDALARIDAALADPHHTTSPT